MPGWSADMAFTHRIRLQFDGFVDVPITKIRGISYDDNLDGRGVNRADVVYRDLSMGCCEYASMAWSEIVSVRANYAQR